MLGSRMANTTTAPLTPKGWALSLPLIPSLTHLRMGKNYPLPLKASWKLFLSLFFGALSFSHLPCCQHCDPIAHCTHCPVAAHTSQPIPLLPSANCQSWVTTSSFPSLPLLELLSGLMEQERRLPLSPFTAAWESGLFIFILEVTSPFCCKVFPSGKLSGDCQRLFASLLVCLFKALTSNSEQSCF